MLQIYDLYIYLTESDIRSKLNMKLEYKKCFDEEERLATRVAPWFGLIASSVVLMYGSTQLDKCWYGDWIYIGLVAETLHCFIVRFMIHLTGLRSLLTRLSWPPTIRPSPTPTTSSTSQFLISKITKITWPHHTYQSYQNQNRQSIRPVSLSVSQSVKKGLIVFDTFCFYQLIKTLCSAWVMINWEGGSICRIAQGVVS